MDIAIFAGHEWLRRKDWKERAQDIERMLAHCVGADPGRAAPVLTLGDLHEKLGHDNQAVDVYRRALSSYPGQVDVISRLVTLLERQRRFTEMGELLDSIPQIRSSLTFHRRDAVTGLGDDEAATSRHVHCPRSYAMSRWLEYRASGAGPSIPQVTSKCSTGPPGASSRATVGPIE